MLWLIGFKIVTELLPHSAINYTLLKKNAFSIKKCLNKHLGEVTEKTVDLKTVTKCLRCLAGIKISVI